MEEQPSSPNYQKGFNDGYIMTGYVPHLADQIAAVDSDSERLDGFRHGRKQFTLEQVREHRPDWMTRTENDIRGNDIAKEHGKDRDD